MEEGVVKSASLVVNYADSPRAADLAGRKNIALGLQINCTEGSPVSREDHVASLLDANGYFLTHDRLMVAIEEGVIEREHLEREIRAQIEWFLEHCGSPTHVCSFDHIHVHPFIAPVLSPILSRYGMRFVRIPTEVIAENDPWDLSPEQRASIDRIAKQAREAKAIFAANDIGFTDHFRGLALQGNAGSRRLRSLITGLEEGTTELMVHPGQCDPTGETFEKDPQRETERNMLLDPELPAFIRGRGIELIGYGEL